MRSHQDLYKCSLNECFNLQAPLWWLLAPYFYLFRQGPRLPRDLSAHHLPSIPTEMALVLRITKLAWLLLLRHQTVTEIQITVDQACRSVHLPQVILIMTALDLRMAVHA